MSVSSSTASAQDSPCLLYTSDAADDLTRVDLGGRRIIKKKKKNLDFFALQPALPDMAHDFDAPTTNIQLVISGYMLALGAFLIPGGRVGDILGRKRMLIA